MSIPNDSKIASPRRHYGIRSPDAARVEHVRRLAIAVKKARRETELCEFDWRLNPNSDSLHAARAAQQARTAAEVELREQLLGDQDLFADVMRSMGR